VQFDIPTGGDPANTTNDAIYNIYDGPAAGTPFTQVTINQLVSLVGPVFYGFTFQDLTLITPTTNTITVVVAHGQNDGKYLAAGTIRVATPGSPPSALFSNSGSVTANASNATVSFSSQQGGTAPYTYSFDFGNTGTFEVTNSTSPTATIPESYLTTPNSTLVVRGRITNSTGDYTDYTTTVTIGAQGYIVTPDLSPGIPDPFSNPLCTNNVTPNVSIASGNWSTPAIWSLDRVPIAGDIVGIMEGTTVTYDVNDSTLSTPLATVEVQNGGTLTFSTAASTEMFVGNMVVLAGGTLNIGTQANPIPVGITAQVVWINQALNTTCDPEQYLHGLTVLGTMNTYGAVKVPYVTLAAEPHAGNTSLVLTSPATGWQVGDSLRLPDTRQLDSSDLASNYIPQWESLKIAGISTDGLTVTLVSPLQYDHLGAYDDKNTLRYLPHVLDITRNVEIRSQSASGTRGYALFTYRANVDLENTAFTGMGRTTGATMAAAIAAGAPAQLFDNTTFDSNGNVTHVGTNEGNRNAITFLNLVGPVPPQNGPAGQNNGRTLVSGTGPQFTFVGNVVMCPLTPMPFVWGINVTNSYYGLIQNNDIVNWAGSLVYVDNSSSYNEFRNNMAMLALAGEYNTHNRGGYDLGFGGNGFWFGNPNNIIYNNVATDIDIYDGYSYAFEIYSGPETGQNFGGELLENIPNCQGCDPSQNGQFQTVDMSMVPLNFTNNEAYGATNIGMSYWTINMGSLAWQINNLNGAPPLPNGGSIKNFVTWHDTSVGIYGYQSNNVLIDGFVDIGSTIALNNGWGGEGFEPQDYLIGHANCNSSDPTQNTCDFMRNSEIDNVATGIRVPDNLGTNPVIIIRNTHLADLTGFFDWMLWSVSETNAGLTRQTVLDNDTFGPPYGYTQYTAIGAPSWQSFEIPPTPTNLDQILVYNFNGVAGNNFQVFRPQQTANSVVPETTFNQDGTIAINGCTGVGQTPEAGLTNTQCMAQFGRAMFGQIAPANATTANCPADANGNALILGNDLNGNPLPALCAQIP